MLLEVGRIGRAHGLKGEVMVDLITDRLERVAVGTVLSTDRGDMVVAGSRPHQKRFIVAFEGVSDRTSAEALAGTVLRAESVDDPEALWVHELVGTLVVEANGTEHGIVRAVQANPAHDLLVLESGALVPIVFVVSCVDGVTLIEPPPGLFDF